MLVLLVLLVLVILFTAVRGVAGVARYETGDLIDLAEVRGVKVWASENLRRDHPGASFVLHRAEGEIRFDNHFGACWWMMELPGVYGVSDVRLVFRDVIASVGFEVKIAEEDPGDWGKVKAAARFSGATTPAAHGVRVAAVHFEGARGRFVRIEFLGQNGGEHGAGSGHEDLVVSSLQVWGPNDGVEVSPAISVSQSAWAGGRCTLKDCTGDARDCAVAINENERDAAMGDPMAVFFTRGSPAADVQQTDQPASFVVSLKNRVRVTGVGYSAMSVDRLERPRDVKIFTSPVSMGNEWTEQKEAKDISAGEYVEIGLDQAAVAMRVRVDVERVWNPNVDDGRKAAEGHIAQLYVYGEGMEPDVEVPAEPGLMSCGILDGDGKLVRVLEKPTRINSKRFGICWDGLDDLGTPLPPGEYTARVVVNPTVYRNVGIIGNNAQPPTTNQNPTSIASIACDAAGNVFTADLWDEASQDFRKWDRETGRRVFDAHGQIRSGNPNGLAYAIAVDEKYIYCSTFSHTNHGQAHLRRFRLSDGEAAPFSAGGAMDGHILIHDKPEDEIPFGTDEDVAEEMKRPLKGIALVGEKLFVTDELAGKILCFDRETGAAISSFETALPVALAADSQGRLWIGHSDGTISVSQADGSAAKTAWDGQWNSGGKIRAMAIGPGDVLYVADDASGAISIFVADGKARVFGRRAKPGDYAADAFYEISALAVDGKGNLIVAQRLPVDGTRLTKFWADGKVAWDELGAEFCNTGNSSAEHPDEVITQDLHRYVLDKEAGTAEFRGSVLDGDAHYLRWPHGPLRMVKLNGTEFLFQCYGDGLQVYRREGDLFRLCSMFGCVNPLPDGRYRDAMDVPDSIKPPKRLWSWHDENGDGKVDAEEITYQESPWGRNVEWDNFGINVDSHGNALLCEFNNSITEVPVTGFDEKGNPIYDLFQRRTVIAKDPSAKPLLSDPIMAVRGDDGSIYVFSRSKVFPAPPESGGGWMAGWMLARYDAGGKRLWFTRLPEACPGMDYIPGGGVMLVSMKSGADGCNLYHYTADGALAGICHPAAKFLDPGGIPDNTGSLSLSRDPRDGVLDVFAEDCLGNRFYWYRVDDRKKIVVRNVGVELVRPGEALRVIKN